MENWKENFEGELTGKVTNLLVRVKKDLENNQNLVNGFNRINFSFIKKIDDHINDNEKLYRDVACQFKVIDHIRENPSMISSRDDVEKTLRQSPCDDNNLIRVFIANKNDVSIGEWKQKLVELENSVRNDTDQKNRFSKIENEISRVENSIIPQQNDMIITLNELKNKLKYIETNNYSSIIVKEENPKIIQEFPRERDYLTKLQEEMLRKDLMHEKELSHQRELRELSERTISDSSGNNNLNEEKIILNSQIESLKRENSESNTKLINEMNLLKESQAQAKIELEKAKLDVEKVKLETDLSLEKEINKQHMNIKPVENDSLMSNTLLKDLIEQNKELKKAIEDKSNDSTVIQQQNKEANEMKSLMLDKQIMSQFNKIDDLENELSLALSSNKKEKEQNFINKTDFGKKMDQLEKLIKDKIELERTNQLKINDLERNNELKINDLERNNELKLDKLEEISEKKINELERSSDIKINELQKEDSKFEELNSKISHLESKLKKINEYKHNKHNREKQTLIKEEHSNTLEENTLEIINENKEMLKLINQLSGKIDKFENKADTNADRPTPQAQIINNNALFDKKFKELESKLYDSKKEIFNLENKMRNNNAKLAGNKNAALENKFINLEKEMEYSKKDISGLEQHLHNNDEKLDVVSSNQIVDTAIIAKLNIPSHSSKKHHHENKFTEMQLIAKNLIKSFGGKGNIKRINIYDFITSWEALIRNNVKIDFLKNNLGARTPIYNIEIFDNRINFNVPISIKNELINELVIFLGENKIKKNIKKKNDKK